MYLIILLFESEIQQTAAVSKNTIFNQNSRKVIIHAIKSNGSYIISYNVTKVFFKNF